MSNEINTQIIEDLLDRAQPHYKHAPSAELDLGQYLANDDIEGATEFVERLEAEIPLMLDGREQNDD